MSFPLYCKEEKIYNLHLIFKCFNRIGGVIVSALAVR